MSGDSLSNLSSRKRNALRQRRKIFLASAQIYNAFEDSGVGLSVPTTLSVKDLS
jgi:hypothetical protein